MFEGERMNMLISNDEVSKDSVGEYQDYSNYEDAIYMYELPGTGLFESTKIIKGLEFASIESLKKS